ncbi:MAG TPA: delta-60 repeat domain-containing protein [Baekduia sp.]|nr:delta-60 repeat domain-containing protein [Baekduia sp.]
MALTAVGAGAQTAPAEPFAPSNVAAGDLTVVGYPSPRVTSFAQAGSALYLGGTFSGIGHATPGVVPIDATTGTTQGLPARLDSLLVGQAAEITAVAPGPGGAVFIGGRFRGSDSVVRPRLLRLNADGTLDPSFAPALDFGSANSPNTVVDLAYRPPTTDRPGGTLYLAGPVQAVGGAPRSQLAAVDAETGALIDSWAPPAIQGGSVAQIELGASFLYVRGTFTGVDNAPRHGLAAFAVGSGKVTGWDPQPAGGSTLDLAAQGDVVYLAGAFTSIAGTPRRFLAAVSAGGTGALVSAWNPNPSSVVSHVAATASALYLSGAFASLGSGTPVTRTRLAAVELAGGTATGAATAWNPTSSSEPTALLAAGDTVYVGLSSMQYDPSDDTIATRVGGTIRCGIAAVAAGGSGEVKTTWDPHLALAIGDCASSLNRRVIVSALASSGSTIWAGGTFDAAGVQARSDLAAIDLSSNQPLPWAPAVNADGVVRDLVVSLDGGTVYFGGEFTRVGAADRKNAAAATTSGAGTVTAWAPAADGAVRAMALSPAGDRVYLAGAFSHVVGAENQFNYTRNRIVGVSSSGAGTVASWSPNITGGTLSDVAVAPDGRVLVAGTFTAIGSAARTGIAAIDPASGAAIADWAPALSAGARVTTLALGPAAAPQPRLYLGGRFTTAAGGAANLAAADLATGAISGDWHPAVTSTSTAAAGVAKVSVDPVDGTVYLLGTFNAVAGAARQAIASVTADGAVTEWNPAPGSQEDLDAPTPAGVLRLTDSASSDHVRIALGGGFTSLQTRAKPALALFSSAAPPTPAVAPTIVGMPTPGTSLLCAAGTFGGSPGSSSFAWLGGDGAVIGAGQTYVVAAADLGATLRCRQTLSNAAGSATQVSAGRAVELLKPELDVAPSVAGDAWIGGVARCTTGLWRNGPQSFAYRWKIDGAPIPGAEGQTHRVEDAEQDRALSCEVTAANSAGASVPADSARVTVTEAPPANLASPLVAGTPRVGAQLTCDVGTWVGARSFAYAWLRDGATIGGEAGAEHTAKSTDVGHELRCLVTAANRGGATTVQSAPAIVVPAPHTAAFFRPGAGDTTGAGSTTKPAVDIRSIRLSGSVVVARIATPAAGRLSITVATRAKRPATLARQTVGAARRATLTVKLPLGPKARRRLSKAGSRGLAVRLAVTFRPRAGGTALRDDAATKLHARRR